MKAILTVAAVWGLLLSACAPTAGDDAAGRDRASTGAKGEPVPGAVRNPLDGPYLIPGEAPIHPGFVTPPSISRPGDFQDVDIDGDIPWDSDYGSEFSDLR